MIAFCDCTSQNLGLEDTCVSVRNTVETSHITNMKLASRQHSLFPKQFTTVTLIYSTEHCGNFHQTKKLVLICYSTQWVFIAYVFI